MSAISGADHSWPCSQTSLQVQSTTARINCPIEHAETNKQKMGAIKKSISELREKIVVSGRSKDFRIAERSQLSLTYAKDKVARIEDSFAAEASRVFPMNGVSLNHTFSKD